MILQVRMWIQCYNWLVKMYKPAKGNAGLLVPSLVPPVMPQADFPRMGFFFPKRNMGTHAHIYSYVTLQFSFLKKYLGRGAHPSQIIIRRLFH